MKGKQKMKGINQKGFGHHLLIIIVAVLAVGAAGFAGWKIYSAKKLDAKAESSSVLGNGGEFIPLDPSRIMDTRNGNGGYNVAIPANGTYSLQVLGRGGVPAADVVAANFIITAIKGSSSGFITAYPSGISRPTTSSINFAASQVIANSATIKVGRDGKINIFNGSSGNINVALDVMGYYSDTNGTNGLRHITQSQTRLLDTRTGVGGYRTVPAGGEVVVSVPDTLGTEAVEGMVATLNSTSSGYLTVYPADASRPNSSVLNFAPGQKIANTMIVRTSSDKKVKIYNGSNGTVDILFDLVSVFGDRNRSNSSAWGKFVAIDPIRIVDTRSNLGIVGQLQYGQFSKYNVYGVMGLPNNLDTIAANTTIIQPQADGYICNCSLFNVSSMNFAKGQTIASMMNVPVYNPGYATVYNGSKLPTHLAVDVYGYFVYK